MNAKEISNGIMVSFVLMIMKFFVTGRSW